MPEMPKWKQNEEGAYTLAWPANTDCSIETLSIWQGSKEEVNW